MASLRHEIRINASPDAVWRVIEDPMSIPTWFPGIVSCAVDGTVRTITTAAGLVIPEELLVIDPILRRFAYRITAPLYTFHFATIDVIEVGECDSLCVYSTSAEPDTLALLIAGGTVGALEQIKQIAESTGGP